MNTHTTLLTLEISNFLSLMSKKAGHNFSNVDSMLNKGEITYIEALPLFRDSIWYGRQLWNNSCSYAERR